MGSMHHGTKIAVAALDKSRTEHTPYAERENIQVTSTSQLPIFVATFYNLARAFSGPCGAFSGPCGSFSGLDVTPLITDVIRAPSIADGELRRIPPPSAQEDGP